MNKKKHGGREYDDLQNWLEMTSHENPLLACWLYNSEASEDTEE